MAEETVVIKFIGDDQVTKVAEAAGDAVANVGQKASTSGGGFNALQSIATGAMMRIGEAAINLAGGALSKIGDFVTGSIKESSDWNRLTAQTAAVVKSTGQAAGFSAKQLGDMAQNMSAASGMSIFSDDAILGSENVLATFTEIKGTTFTGATQAILDISQAMGTDLQSSAVQVGKALNDPIAGISALSRVGVSFTEDQKAMIKSMVESGDVAGAQQMILAELGKEFGGSAAAAVDTFAGQQIVLAEQFKNVQQSLGDALLPVLMRFGSFAQETLVPAVQDLVNVFITWIDGVDWDGVINYVGGIADALYDFIYGTDWQGGLDNIGAGFDTFMSFIEPITTALSGLYATAAPILTELYDNIISGVASPEVQGALSTLTTVFTLLADIFVGVVALAISGMTAQFKAFYDLLLIVWPYIQIFINGMMTIIQPWVDLVVGALSSISLLLKGDFLGAWNTLKSAVMTFFTDVGTATATFITDMLIKLGTLLIAIDDKAKEIGTNIIKGIAKGISDAKQSVINAITGACNDAIAAAKKLLGIASPSSLFADQIGYQMSAGMAAGIVKGIPDVTSAIGAVSGAGVGAVNQTTQNYYLSASYQTAQSESSISQDLRAMQLLAGGMA